MFTQTKDKQNWQTRYVIQNPYAGSVAACSETVAKNDCEAMCKAKVPEVSRMASQRVAEGIDYAKKYLGKSSAELKSDCTQACTTSKRTAIELAARYYERVVPTRLAAEKQTLAKLTGWSMAEIDRMAAGSGVPGNVKPVAGDVQVPDARTWWQKLFSVFETGKRALSAS